MTHEDFNWLNHALDGNSVMQLGQVPDAYVKVLNQAVRAGKLKKGKGRFMGISPLKTIWYREDRIPQEVMVHEYYKQKNAA